LPVWRRSGFWTTSLQKLQLDALRGPPAPSGTTPAVPEVVERTLPRRPRAGRIVQSANATVQLELDPDLRARGVILCSLEDAFRCRVAQVQDWGAGEVFDVSTRFVGVGRDAYCHWLPALLGGHLVRQHLELAVSEPGGEMAFRGLLFTEEQEHLDVFAVDLHETGPSGGDVHWRGAATGSSRASFEGLIQINPGAQQTHT